MDRLFTIDEAEALLPVLEPVLRELIALQSECDELQASLRRRVEAIARDGGAIVDHAPFLEARGALAAAAGRMEALSGLIDGHGVLLKDLEKGLLDFPALLDGERILLCWMLGEERIEYWHRVEDGFRGRRPVGPEFPRRTV